MSSQAPNNNRASLLAGLRTGGVRSTSGPSMPHTAAPGGSFQVPRFPSSSYDDQMDDMGNDSLGHNLNMRRPSMPITASAADSSAPRFQQQQLAQQQMMMRHLATQRANMNGNQYGGMDLQAQAQMQLQMQQMQMQMQMMALQQQQQYQAQLAAQAQQQAASTRGSLSAPRRMDQPSTAGPLQTSFDIRNGLPSNRVQHQGMNSLGVDDSLTGGPMTAALGGKFGSRTAPVALNPNANVFVGRNTLDTEDPYSKFPSSIPSTPVYGSTTVISGGTSLGGGPLSPMPQQPQQQQQQHATQMTPSKSDTAVSWRRGGATAAAVKPLPPRAPLVTISKPSNVDDSPISPIGTGGLFAKSRPQPLSFSVSPASNDVTIDHPVTPPESNQDPIALAIDGGDSYPSAGSPPSSPESSGSSLAREGSPKKAYEGLGVGRAIPTSHVASQQTHNGSPQSLPNGQGSFPNGNRLPSYPIRQPRGPPAGAEDLGQRNFASRLRRKAVGGLSALVGARERRDVAPEITAY